MKRVLLILICICLLLCGCDTELSTQNVLGAYGTETQQENQDTDTGKLQSLTMLYYPDMDTNPVTTNCLANHELLKFVYSPLISLNAGFEPIGVLAKGWVVEENKVTVTIKSGIVFSNGEPVTAHDVVKSYNAVKSDPLSPYYSSVNSMYRYYAQSDTKFVCIFNYRDIDAVAMLDIPVMYDGKVGIGCGAFVFSEQNGKPVLVPNGKYFEKTSVPLINLVETKNDDYIDDLFSSGAIDIIMSTMGEELSLTSLRDYQIVSCPSNRFIYIGMNFANPSFTNVEVRRAISTIIDRSRIAKQSLVGLATPTEYPFNPEWYRMIKAGVTEPDSPKEDEILSAMAVLKDIPLTLTVPTGGYKKTVALELAECFKAAGLTLNLRELDAAAYLAAITAGDFEMYLGETSIPRNMDPTQLYRVGGSMNYGGYGDLAFDAMYDSVKTGEGELATYLSAFNERLPIIPILFSKNVLYCAQGIASFSGRSAFSTYGNPAKITLK